MNKLSTLSWGLYLSSSWTWCIGMFLPVILLHRYGWAGYLVFAVPNVIGCTAFGYVMGSAERSRQFVARYSTVLMAFSLITLVFHFFFVLMLLRIHEVGLALCLLLIAALVVLLNLLKRLSDRCFLLMAILVYAISLVAGSALLETEQVLQTTKPWYEALYLLPLTSIGFLLCPYFDLSFHKALQFAPSKHCFAVFGITFIPLILITALYQDLILAVVPVGVMLHLGGQALFSMSVHAKELSAQVELAERTRVRNVFLGLLAVVCAMMLWPNQTTQYWVDNYLRFFVFYGVLFPCLLIAMAVKKKYYPMLAASVVLAIPFLEFGVIARFAYLAIVPAIIIMCWGWLALVKGKPKLRLRP